MSEWTSEVLPGDVVRIAFSGSGGSGSDGNDDGIRMSAAVREIVTTQRPTGVIVDLTAFEYEFGDWIGAVPIAARRVVGDGRVCVVASGKTATALESLWKLSPLRQWVPLFTSLDEAKGYLSRRSDNES